MEGENENKKGGKGWWLIWGAGIIGALLFAPIFGQITSEITQKLFSDYDRQRAYRSIEEQVRRNMPQKIDELTTAIAFKIDRESAEYLYEISPVVAEFDIEIIKNKNISGICAIWKDYFEKGVTGKVIYAYRLNENRHSFDINSDDCAKF